MSCCDGHRLGHGLRHVWSLQGRSCSEDSSWRLSPSRASAPSARTVVSLEGRKTFHDEQLLSPAGSNKQGSRKMVNTGHWSYHTDVVFDIGPTEAGGRWSILRRWQSWLQVFCQPCIYEEFKCWFKCTESIITEYTNGSILTWAKEPIHRPSSYSVNVQTASALCREVVSWKLFTTGMLQWCFSQFCNHLFFCPWCFQPCVWPWGPGNDETQPLLQEAHNPVN